MSRPPHRQVAFFHKATKTIILTDALQYVEEDPPEVCPVDSLLIRARDGPGLVLEDSLSTRRQGWGKIVLFALYFKPQVVSPAIFKLGTFNLGDGFEWDPKWCGSSSACHVALIACCCWEGSFPPPVRGNSNPMGRCVL